MEYKNTIEAVYINIDEIQQLVSKFGAEGQVRTIDIDLTLSKLRDVYELMLSLQNEARGKGIEEGKVAPKESPKSSDVSVVEESVVAEEKTVELTFEIEKEEIEDVIPEPEPIQEELEKPHETQASRQSRVRTLDEKRLLGDSFSNEQVTLNEGLLNEKQKSDLSSRLTTRPITSISAAIGLNEKFELLHNLFAGDNEKYEHTMNVLNLATNFNEAYEYLSGNFNWDMNDPLVQRVLELIRRKLIVRK